jgi:hypothetical protein
MFIDYNYFITFYIKPNELNNNFNNLIDNKVQEFIKNKKQNFGIINKLKKINNINIGKIEFETCNFKVCVNVVFEIYDLNNKQFITTIQSITDNGLYCNIVNNNEILNDINIFVLKDSYIPKKTKKNKLENIFELNNKINVEIIKTKFINNDWMILGKII